MSKQDDFARYTIRIPRAIYTEVEAAAARNNRSINGEIIARLEGGAETLRDKAALAALSGLIGPDDDGATAPAVYAEHAFAIADAFMAARSGASS